MGTVTHTVAPVQGGDLPVASRGGIRFKTVRSKSLMGATYATGGDTVTLPTAPDGYSLYEVRITSSPSLPVGISLHWDGSTSTPKILAYDEDNTSGVQAELANASAALVAAVVFLEFVYKSGA